MSKRVTTTEAPLCQGCGEPLPRGHTFSVCPRCLWKGASQEPDDTGEKAPEHSETLGELAELLPDFEWLEVIGRGGMGTVYKARQRRLDRLVAIKVLAEEISVEPRFASRFEREAKILARLNHPHIVTIHDFGQEIGLYYLVMELVGGIDLARLMRRGPLPVERSVRMARQLCAALVFAHEREVLHRDIKPANILVDADGLVKMADFGLAKLGPVQDQALSLTLPGSAMGTPRYMAPEQWETPEEIDHRADLFSFGMIFYELLTSEVPSGMIDLPSKKISIDGKADDVVRHCLAPDPNKRYRSARELEQALLELEQSLVGSGSSGDSWLRPPMVVLPEEAGRGEGDSAAFEELETVVDLKAQEKAEPVGRQTGSGQRSRDHHVENASAWGRRAFVAAAVAGVAVLSGGGYWLFQRRGPHPNSPIGFQLATIPSLTEGPWWFDDLPFLVPPLRAALEENAANLFEVQDWPPLTASETARFGSALRQQSQALAESADDVALSELLEPLLLTRNVDVGRALAALPESLVRDDPRWKHTQAILEHRSGNLEGSLRHYREAIRAYRIAEVGSGKHEPLVALCHSDLARAYLLSGRVQEASASFDRAMQAASGGELAGSLFKISCLTGLADACRRFEAWEDAEQALLGAQAIMDRVGMKEGHPMQTYLHARFGWLYMDDWRVQEARDAFSSAIRSRDAWKEAVDDDSIFLQLRKEHDELAFAMSQRYSGHEAEAIAGYASIRERLHEMRERVRRMPAYIKDWQSRYFNTCERFGDCFLYSETLGDQAAHHYSQAAVDLRRERAVLSEGESPDIKSLYGRLRAKETVALVVQGSGAEEIEKLRGELEQLSLSGSHRDWLGLMIEAASMIERAMSDEDLALVLTELKAKIDQGDAAQFGRDVREVLLLVCRVCASRCKGDQHRALAEATTRLLPRDPVDPSVLPFLRPHFDRLFAARFESGPLNWSIVRDLHWAKKGARLDHDLPERPLMLFYLRPQDGYVIGFDAREDTHQVIEVPHGYEDLKNLASHALVANLWESMIESGSFDVYWSDDGLLSLLDSDSFPWSVPQGARIH